MATLTFYGGNKTSISTKNHYYIGVSDSDSTTHKNYRAIYEISNLNNKKQIHTISLTTGIMVTNGVNLRMRANCEARLYITKTDAQNYANNAIATITQVIETNASGNNFTFVFDSLSLSGLETVYITFMVSDREKISGTYDSITLFEIQSKADAPITEAKVVITEKELGYVNIYTNNTAKWQPYTIHIHDGTAWNQYIPYIYNGTKWVPYT